MTSNKIRLAALMAALPLAALTSVAAVGAVAPPRRGPRRTTVHNHRALHRHRHVVHRHRQPGGRRQQRAGGDPAARGRDAGEVRATHQRRPRRQLPDQRPVVVRRPPPVRVHPECCRSPQGSALQFRFTRPSGSTPHIVRCTGNASLCHATIPIGGGASNRKVVVQLPGTDLGLVAVKPSSQTLEGAYSMTRQHLRAGDSEYAFVLSAVQGAPRGAHLTLTFAS